MILQRQLPRDRTAVPAARALMREQFAGKIGRRQLVDLELAVTELVANAVMHGSGPIELRVELDDGTVRGQIIDQGEGFEAELRERGAEEVGGRGLMIVGALSARWGVFEGSSHVWFEITAGADDETVDAPELGTPPDEVP